jgi:Tfp pilus assembly protein PilO
VLLIAAAVLGLFVRPSLQAQQRGLLQSYVARLDQTVQVRDSEAQAQAARDPRDVMWEALPTVAERGAVIARFIEKLEAGTTLVERATYENETVAPGLVRTRVTVPVRGSYAGQRELVARVLNALPHAALDSVQMERATETDHLNAQVRFSLFFRQEAP